MVGSMFDSQWQKVFFLNKNIILQGVFYACIQIQLLAHLIYSTIQYYTRGFPSVHPYSSLDSETGCTGELWSKTNGKTKAIAFLFLNQQKNKA